ncbi:hypothetical protein [Shewanella sp. SM21]|uniref:hypothetical protein n=1 Tax=Shewanella sp. SM21 TaxID=2912793 RepID=UPI0021D8C9F1|nr:hypothetical protein [Shewanella sp. SM21]MCU8089766.1 hypothetical protein [Shewanella sp. SM21]
MKFKKRLLLSFLPLFACNVWAGGFTAFAIPTRIDIDRGNGLMVFGAFGNPGGCTVGDRIYININHPQYQQIYAAILAAFASGKKIQAYSHECKPASWYSVEAVTYNHVEPYSAVNLMN